jgi:glycine cleavage system H lipoate-binding protein
MDLKELKVQEEGKRLDLRHPVTGEVLTYGKDNEKTMYLVIGSSDSETYKKSQRKVIDRRLKQQQKFRQVRMTAAQLEEEATISLAEVTYDGRVFLEGKELKVTPGQVAQDLYKEYGWIKEQASEHLEDRGTFLQS